MSNKKVLYIGTPIFNYHKSIVSEFKQQGYCVDYYNDRPSERSIVKGIIKIKKSLMNFIIQRYFDKILSETKENSYDLVFIVNCKVFTPLMIRQLRDSQKSARFVLYMWDSLNLYPNSKELIPIFDKAYSFDLDDCNEIGKLAFMPLFYCKEYEELGKEEVSEREYDIVSVCTSHPNRYKTMHELFPKLEAKGIRIFSYMFLNKLQYLYNKVSEPEFKDAKRNEFKFKPLSEQENLAVLRKSNTVFDMQHNMQSGLTMRTIETLGAKRKMVTTNTNIVKYDFYNKNNIFVMNENNLDEIEEFINNKYVPISEDIYKKYSLHNWVETIINERNNNYFI
ncbi:hypothetical protein K9O30_03645 [Clostridium bowmanii]|uniref:hypothetical protein n=1 Tax=Clostridium bowmanii TaxID=132925 RepID=UPI001C0A99CA|nr:hypothetical protein [Clostridium bowmanii]MBU3188451.1 hypothetical protein [Clostridium bowmanii]MCA1072839.1 hypothetical protein [Clostridium bowmanii]